MLLADVEPQTYGSVLIVLMALATGLSTVVTLILALLTYLKKDRPRPESDYITRGELNQESIRLEGSLREARDVMRNEVSRLDSDVRQMRDDLRASDRETNKKLHAINLRSMWMMNAVYALCNAQNPKITLPPQPAISEEDEA